MAIVLAGCPKPPSGGECKTSADCANQAGYGKVCVEGRCQECAADSDCQPGFACRDNKCVPRPECATDADCPSDKMCQAEKCVGRPAPPPPAEPEKPRVDAACADEAGFTIYFGFDQSVLTSQSQGTLQKLSDCSREGVTRLVVSGHCDERGTTEYNLALGSRRAEAAKRYLSDLGVSARIETATAGEERPVCQESNEACWSRNRRAEFQIVR
ncbi:MAG TPA: OmpA family protein [Anaeromyxobacteraceae bacterium]|nr:OmpA family protein [Anaeromyxobacteraceae bacterium]